MRRKIALITGGAGFIGAHLCRKLLREDFIVYCLDNFITGSRENIKEIERDKNFRINEHNVSKYISVRGRVDYVLHCASLASPVDYFVFPIQTLKVGSLGTYNALGLAKEKKSVFMLFSTSEVYGDPKVHPQKENYWGNVNPVGVRGCYDESKRFAEALTMAYHRVHKLNTKIVRIFNTYGPMMRPHDGRVVSNFINQALKDSPLTVYGRGRQTRSFCYVDDLVDGLYRLMSSALNSPVNLGNPGEFTILQLARLILKITGSKSKIIFKNLPEDDPRQRKPDIGLARSALNWSPKVKLAEGIVRTAEWFAKKQKNT